MTNIVEPTIDSVDVYADVSMDAPVDTPVDDIIDEIEELDEDLRTWKLLKKLKKLMLKKLKKMMITNTMNTETILILMIWLLRKVL